MKQAFNLFLLTVIVFMTGCKKEKKEHTTYFKTIKYSYDAFSYDDHTVSPVADADYKIYKDLVDFASESSPVQEGKTGADGVFTYVRESFEPVNIYIKKGELNSLRFLPDGKCIYGSGDESTRKFLIQLSTTPVKLRLIVKNAGVEVSDATVTLYISEEDYTNDYRYTYEDMNPDTGVTPPTSSVITNSYGEAYFEKLEPREYWIRIKKGNLTNKNTKSIVLQDNYNIDVVKQQEIGIQ